MLHDAIFSFFNYYDLIAMHYNILKLVNIDNIEKFKDPNVPILQCCN